MKKEVNVPDGKSGIWEVSTFEISKDDSFFTMMSFRDRYVRPGIYKRLKRGDTIVMSNTTAEIREMMPFVWALSNAKTVLINGLGLGIAVQAALDEPTVEKVTVIEISPDVIKLVGPTYSSDKRLEIIQADAYEYKPPKGAKYDVVWHDIWDSIVSENLPGMAKLHRKYGSRTEWQDSWCKKRCQNLRRQERQDEKSNDRIRSIVGGRLNQKLSSGI